MTDGGAPPFDGYERLDSRSPFVNHAGAFFIRKGEDGSVRIAAQVGEVQSNAEGYVHGGFLLTFVDFALSIATMGITLNLAADFLRPARIGDWLEAHITIRKRSSAVIFAEALVFCGGEPLLRANGLFRPFEKRT